MSGEKDPNHITGTVRSRDRGNTTEGERSPKQARTTRSTTAINQAGASALLEAAHIKSETQALSNAVAQAVPIPIDDDMPGLMPDYSLSPAHTERASSSVVAPAQALDQVSDRLLQAAIKQSATPDGYEAAIILLDNVLGKHPNNTTALQSRIIACINVGGEENFQTAQKDLKTGLKANSTDPVTAASFYSLQASLDREQKKPDDAIRNCTKAIEHDPTKALYHHQLGAIFIVDKEDPTAAIAPLKKAIELTPNDHRIYCDLTTAYNSVQKYDEASAVIQDGLKIPNLQQKERTAMTQQLTATLRLQIEVTDATITPLTKQRNELFSQISALNYQINPLNKKRTELNELLSSLNPATQPSAPAQNTPATSSTSQQYGTPQSDTVGHVARKILNTLHSSALTPDERTVLSTTLHLELASAGMYHIPEVLNSLVLVIDKAASFFKVPSVTYAEKLMKLLKDAHPAIFNKVDSILAVSGSQAQTTSASQNSSSPLPLPPHYNAPASSSSHGNYNSTFASSLTPTTNPYSSDPNRSGAHPYSWVASALRTQSASTSHNNSSSSRPLPPPLPPYYPYSHQHLPLPPVGPSGRTTPNTSNAQQQQKQNHR